MSYKVNGNKANDLLFFLKGIYYWKLSDHRLASLTFSSNI